VSHPKNALFSADTNGFLPRMADDSDGSDDGPCLAESVHPADSAPEWQCAIGRLCVLDCPVELARVPAGNDPAGRPLVEPRSLIFLSLLPRRATLIRPTATCKRLASSSIPTTAARPQPTARPLSSATSSKASKSRPSIRSRCRVSSSALGRKSHTAKSLAQRSCSTTSSTSRPTISSTSSSSTSR
jgi:hypothetical protein